ncbi:MAG: hypothetical protein HYX68_09405 [Planctomycetes bacterium]|nr:hypothetical protein [Planctomycetota bacterium]
MILLDTHIWYWWIENNSKLTGFQRAQILKHHGDGLAVSIISVWEIAKLHSAGNNPKNS